MANIKPLSDRVVVQPEPAEEKTSSGLYIPDSATAAAALNAGEADIWEQMPPDLIPLLGQLDDIGVLLLFVEGFARLAPAELSVLAERWRPWRAYAAMLLWGSLSGSGG